MRQRYAKREEYAPLIQEVTIEGVVEEVRAYVARGVRENSTLIPSCFKSSVM